MPQNIYVILGIGPTDDFIKVKKAYLRKALSTHPDKHPDRIEEATEEFKKLQHAYELVNTEEKLKAYYQAFSSGNVEDFKSASFDAPSKTKEATSAGFSTSLYIPKTDPINIFIPVNVCESDGNVGSAGSTLILNKLKKEIGVSQFNAEFDFNKVASCLNFMSRKSSFQVGMTHKEAMEIASLHSHYYYTVIVKVTISLTRLTERMSEAKVWGAVVLNARSDSNYFWLHQDTVFAVQDIISICPMTARDYQNSMKWGCATPISLLWPGAHTVINSSGTFLEATAVNVKGAITSPVQDQKTTESEEVTTSQPADSVTVLPAPVIVGDSFLVEDLSSDEESDSQEQSLWYDDGVAPLLGEDKQLPRLQVDKDQQLELASKDIEKLIKELRSETQSSGFIRFFTDFHGTKMAKLHALESLKALIGAGVSYEGLCVKAGEYLADPAVTHTSWPLQSRTVRLLNELVELNDPSVAAARLF